MGKLHKAHSENEAQSPISEGQSSQKASKNDGAPYSNSQKSSDTTKTFSRQHGNKCRFSLPIPVNPFARNLYFRFCACVVYILEQIRINYPELSGNIKLLINTSFVLKSNLKNQQVFLMSWVYC
jgi:hypothetical protein